MANNVSAFDYPNPYIPRQELGQPRRGDIIPSYYNPIDVDYQEVMQRPSSGGGEAAAAAVGLKLPGVAKVAGAAVAAYYTAKNIMHPRIDRINMTLNQNIGMLGYQKPFVLLKRNKGVNPDNDSVGELIGKPAYTKCKLSFCKGWTVCQSVKVNFQSASEKEKEIIQQALQEGVYL